MAVVLWVAGIVLSALQLLVAAGLLYYYGLLIAAIRRRRTENLSLVPCRSFAIAIPAHNEAAVIGQTVDALKAQDYPSDLFDIFVAADYCDDQTARVARASGAICYERDNGPRGRKSYALRWLLEQILASARPYDAVVIFDADSQAAPGFLRAMNAALEGGSPLLQGQHIIADAGKGRFGSMAAVDMRLNNLLRNQARENLGLSCRLMGDAMCLDTRLLRQYGWPADSLVEDREYGLYLLTQGIRVRYVPEAVSFGQAAPGWREASTQRLRWYGGVQRLRRKYALRLLWQGLAKGNVAALDQAIELLLPPISVLTGLALSLAAIQVFSPSIRLLLPLLVTALFALAWLVFPFLGLWVDGAPRSAYGALLLAPFYMAWRLWVGLLARLRGRRVGWVRTRRHEETVSPERGGSP